jgi:hypothetical protein
LYAFPSVSRLKAAENLLRKCAPDATIREDAPEIRRVEMSTGFHIPENVSGIRAKSPN